MAKLKGLTAATAVPLRSLSDDRPVGMARHSAMETARIAAIHGWPWIPATAMCMVVPGLGLLILGSKRVAIRSLVAITLGLAIYFVAVATLAAGGTGCDAGCFGDRWSPARTLWFVAGVATILWMPWAVARVRAPKMLAARYRACARAEAQLASCPRCRAAARDQSGWCPSCLSELGEGTVSTDEPLVAATELLALAATPAARAFTSRPYRVGFSSGEMMRIWPSYITSMASMVRRVYPNLTITIERAFRDPADPALLWTCKHMTGTSRDGAREDTRVVGWHRLRDGKLASTWEFMPIPEAAPLGAVQTL